MKILVAHNQKLGSTRSSLYEARIPSRLRGYSGRLRTCSSDSIKEPSSLDLTKHADDFARSIGGDIVYGLAPNRDAYYGVVWNSSTDINEMYSLASTEMRDCKYFDVFPDAAYRQMEIIDEDYKRASTRFPAHSAMSFVNECLKFASSNDTVKCIISDNTEGDRFIGIVGSKEEISKIKELSFDLIK